MRLKIAEPDQFNMPCLPFMDPADWLWSNIQSSLSSTTEYEYVMVMIDSLDTCEKSGVVKNVLFLLLSSHTNM